MLCGLTNSLTHDNVTGTVMGFWRVEGIRSKPVDMAIDDDKTGVLGLPTSP